MSLRSLLLLTIAAVIVAELITAVLIYLPFDASAGQLIGDILLLPTVIVGFYLGIVELRKMRELPDLDVQWSLSGSIELEQSEHNKKLITLDPLIVNRGSAATTWFTVQLEIPKTLLITSQNIRLQRIVGDENNWKCFESAVSYNFTFMSNGQIVMYPEYKMPCCYISFYLFPGREYPETCDISYTIITDKTKATKGYCTVTIEPENLARGIPAKWLLEDMLLKNLFPQKPRRRKAAKTK